ncbi:MAG: histidine phosphatase family protein [Thermoanaerobaculia bacterium]
MRTRLRAVSLLAGILALGAAVATLAAEASASAATTTVFLVRHAEALYPPPEEAPRNPPLNRLGRERATRLAEMLQDTGITAILSTDLHRTLETAGPLAERLRLEIERYDHRALAALAERLRTTAGRFLVSGHSNTTPELVRLLGGEPGEPIDEKTEFDRLYVVTLAPGRPASTVLLRYGEPPGSWPPEDPAALAEP